MLFSKSDSIQTYGRLAINNYRLHRREKKCQQLANYREDFEENYCYFMLSHWIISHTE